MKTKIKNGKFHVTLNAADAALFASLRAAGARSDASKAADKKARASLSANA